VPKPAEREREMAAARGGAPGSLGPWALEGAAKGPGALSSSKGGCARRALLLPGAGAGVGARGMYSQR
jgi:hypothetical protein